MATLHITKRDGSFISLPFGSLRATRRNGAFVNCQVVSGQKIRVTRRDGTFVDIGHTHTLVRFVWCEYCQGTVTGCSSCDWLSCGHYGPGYPGYVS